MKVAIGININWTLKLNYGNMCGDEMALHYGLEREPYLAGSARYTWTEYFRISE